MVCKSRELGIEFQVYAGGQKRETLEQPFDIGVIHASFRIHVEALRNLRILARELTAHLADELK